MVSFSKTFVTGRGTVTFNFSKVECPQRHKYFVSVEEGVNRIASFDIKLTKEGKWKVVEPAPGYIVQVEDRLAAIIEERHKRTFY